MTIVPGKFTPTEAGEAEVVLFEDAFPGICDHRIVLDALEPHPGCVRFVELVFLALLVRHREPRSRSGPGRNRRGDPGHLWCFDHG